MPQLWSMYNKYERLRIDGLKTEDVRTILLSIPTRRVDQWHACAEGELQWRPLAEITDFFDDVRGLKGAEASGHHRLAPIESAAVITRARLPVFEDAPAEWSTGSDFDLQTLQKSERRSEARVARRLRFSLATTDGVFECQTKNISMNGLMVDQAIPPWVPKTFRATLNTESESVAIVCTKVSDTRFQIVDSEAWSVIRKWIVMW